MRLLEVKGNGEFSLTNDLGDDVPPYAILSHTWGKDDEELTIQDMIQGAGKHKAGYKKILFCEQRAEIDGLRYIWIDTCCIDKTNNTELAEAINSMFRWYREATRCYVYLSDVSRLSPSGYGIPAVALWAAFRNSRWFTRGWTLQELIAPKSVEFFCKDGKYLGNKSTLTDEIHLRTGIPISALQGHPLSQFSVSERISWADDRETKRKEDKAYSLMGIFDIHMTLLYGEGRDKAFSRLRRKIDKQSRDLHSEELQRARQAPTPFPEPLQASRKRKNRPDDDLEVRFAALKKSYAQISEERARLKLQLEMVSAENARLKAQPADRYNGTSTLSLMVPFPPISTLAVRKHVMYTENGIVR